MKKVISAWWPTDQQPLSLGRLLVFRKELEMLAQIQCVDKISIYFSGDRAKKYLQMDYVNEALTSHIPISLIPCQDRPEKINWPPQDPEICQWPYHSFRRLSLLTQISNRFPILRWPENIEKQAKRFYFQLKSPGQNPLLSVHLKQQSGGTEESNGDLESWQRLFEENGEITFVLLGKDTVSDHILALPNVVSADRLNITLSVQLAFCGLSDGFLGMASGICNNACMSSIPYIIFKHPDHHVEEMEKELGSADHLPFAKPHQKLWRKIDNINNLRAGMKLVSHNFSEALNGK